MRPLYTAVRITTFRSCFVGSPPTSACTTFIICAAEYHSIGFRSRFAKNTVGQDPNVRALLDAETPTVSIFGKSWDLHVHRALGIDEDQNLKLIGETVKYLKEHGREVVWASRQVLQSDGGGARPAILEINRDITAQLLAEE